MKLIVALIVAFLLPTALRSNDIYLSNGIAATDREWRSEDYREFSSAMKSGRVPIPLLSDEPGSRVLSRICSHSSLAIATNNDAALSERIRAVGSVLVTMADLTKALEGQAALGEKVSGERSLVLAFTLHAASASMALTDEVDRTTPKGSDPEARAEKLRGMRAAFAIAFVDAFRSVIVDGAFTADERLHIFEQMAATAPAFARILPPEMRSGMVRRLAIISERSQSAGEKQAIAAIGNGLGGFAEDLASVSGAEVTETGIYNARPVPASSVQGVVPRTNGGLESLKLVQATTNVPARIGTRFGFRYTILGTPSNAPIVLTVVSKHPPLKNPHTGTTFETHEHQFQSRVGQTYSAYSFDEEWELVPGEFRFEIWHKGRKLCEQAFRVVPDPKLGEGK